MAVDFSEALVAAVLWPPDIPDDDMFALLTGLALADGSSAASERLLRDECLPLHLAEELVARQGVTRAERVSFASREDMPPETLLEWVRKERCAAVLAVLAAKPDLPQVVFETLATRKGTALRNALLFNESAPMHVRAGIGANLLNTDVSDSDKYTATVALDSSELLQHAVFDRLILGRLDACRNVSDWPGLSTPQLHSLLGTVELHVETHWTSYRGAPGRLTHQGNGECREAAGTVWNLANHPAADEALLKRIETLVDSYDMSLLKHPRLAEDVASARQRLAAFAGDCTTVVSAPYNTLVELAVSGVLGSLRLTELAVTNPLFDADIAVNILAAEVAAQSPQLRDITDALIGWAPDLMSAVRVQLANTVAWRVLDPHIREASTDELIAAFDSVADCPERNRLLAVRFAAAAAPGAVTDELVGRFGWFSDAVYNNVDNHPLGVLITGFLRRRFGDHVPTWLVFANIADPSTPLAEAAALAVHTEPPPTPPDPPPTLVLKNPDLSA